MTTPGATTDGAEAAPDPLLNAAALKALAAPAVGSNCDCAVPACAGWESVGQPLGPPALRSLGSLRAPGDDEPTLDEWPGSHYWSANAPISVQHFPYNRCSVWACVRCGRGFLQYTEFGGYYVDHRLRQIDPALVVVDERPG